MNAAAAKQNEPMDVRQATEFDLPKPRDRFQPAERRLDARPGVLTLGVAGMTRRPLIDRAAARARRVLRDMRREPQLARIADKFARVEALVRTDGPPAPATAFHVMVEQYGGDLAFRARRPYSPSQSFAG